MYTILFGLYAYLQIYQQGRMHYYQVSLLLLYLLTTASMILTILSKNQYDLYIISITFTQNIRPIGLDHLTSSLNLEWVFLPLTMLCTIEVVLSSVAGIAIYVTAKWVETFISVVYPTPNISLIVAL